MTVERAEVFFWVLVSLIFILLVLASITLHAIIYFLSIECFKSTVVILR